MNRGPAGSHQSCVRMDICHDIMCSRTHQPFYFDPNFMKSEITEAPMLGSTVVAVVERGMPRSTNFHAEVMIDFACDLLLLLHT